MPKHPLFQQKLVIIAQQLLLQFKGTL